MSVPARIWQKQVGNRGCPREPRINNDQFCIAIALRFDHPLEAARVILRRVAAHDQHHVGVLDIHPAVRHRAPAKRWSQT